MLLFAILLSVCTISPIYAQSTDQNFPTPVRANEIAGVIRARDVGDSRLTSHFYTFEGGQGDLFINIQTTNFTGDVDVYAMPGLRPLTKMVLYADSSVSETGRVIYLRKPEMILLRIEGRTPGDEEATYRIKFAGSFVASKAQEVAPDPPKVNEQAQTNVRVNSVGTIIEVVPKPTPAADLREVEDAKEERAEERSRSADPVAKDERVPEQPQVKQEVVVTDPLPKAEESAKPEGKVPAKRTSRVRNTRASKPPAQPAADAASATAEKTSDNENETKSTVSGTSPKRRASAKKPDPAPEPDPMANVRLVIRFKDGSMIERPMTEVLRFTVERAVLTVISKDGAIGRYQMVDVAGVTIE